MTDISEKLTHMKHMPALITATLATGSPTQSFIITDIVNMSFESHETRGFLLKYLLNQLVSTKNVYVKLKVLLVLTALVERGHIEFKISLSKQTEGIAEASKLVSKEAALASDCSKIRDLANRLLELLFDDSGDNVKRQPTISQFQRQGDGSNFGEGVASSYGGGGASSSYGGGGASSSYGGGGSAPYRGTGSSSGSKYIGFGNTPPPAPSEDIGTKISKAIQKTGLILPGQIDNKPLPYDASYVSMTPVATNYSGPKYAPSYPVSNTGRPTESLLGREHVSGYAGGGWDSHTTQLSAPTRREETVKSDMSSSAGIQSKSAGGSGGGSGGEQERLLVEEITAPGGVRAAPPRDVLNNFITRCKTLDTLAIIECLRDCLSSNEDQVVLRSLFVVEALIRSDVPDVVSYLDLTLEALHTLSSSPNASIRSKATKLMTQLTAQGSQTQEKPQILAVSDDTAVESTSDPSGLFEGLSLTSGSKGRPTPTKHSPKAARSNVTPVAKPSDDLNSLLFDTSSVPPPAPLPDLKPVESTAGDSLLQFEDDNFDPFKANAPSAPLVASSNSKGSANVLSQLSDIGSAPVQQSALVQPLQPAAYPVGGSLLTGTPIGVQQTSGFMVPQYGLGGAGMMQPGTGMMQPGTGMMQPGTGMMQPGTGMMQPGTGMMQPGTGMMQPGTGMMQPGIGMMQPGIGIVPNAQGGVPMMYNPGMMYMTPAGGGTARPVQRPPPTTETSSTDSSFAFLGKSSKGSAFDFVQDEMRNSKKR
eukprot:Em0020g73a